MDESAYLNCIRCGLCLAVCPTYREHLDEKSSPRGRVALARMGLEGKLELSPNLVEQMYACLACMACDAICPVGIQPAELTVSLRNMHEQLHPTGWKQPLFAGLLQHMGRLELATLPLRLYQVLGIRSLVYLSRLNHLLPDPLRDLEAMLPPVPLQPLRRTLPEKIAARGQERSRVGFFLGCAQNLLFAEESAATVRVLRRNGCTVITPKEVQCCGMPALGYGRLDLVQAQAQHNIALLNIERLWRTAGE
jgi:glycolate oxidase iron-sulfur subunit